MDESISLIFLGAVIETELTNAYKANIPHRFQN